MYRAEHHSASLTMPDAVPLGEARVHPLTNHEAVEVVLSWAREGRSALVVTPNVDHVVMLENDGDFRRAYRSAELQLCDGMPLLLLSRLSGAPLPERVTGADLFMSVCARAAEAGLKVFIAGGAEDVRVRGMAELRRRFPTLDIRGYSPPMGFEGTYDDDLLQMQIADAGPDIVMVCFGAPRSEIWATAQVDRYPAVYLCVGAAIDFAAGARKRAPVLLQRAGLEWLFRLVQEPRRMWQRYVVQDRAFVGIVLRHLRGSTRSARTSAR